jgi:hypothetical protein
MNPMIKRIQTESQHDNRIQTARKRNSEIF